MAFKKLKLWFDRDLAILLASKITSVKPDFNTSQFIARVEKGVETLELKARVTLIADEIHHSLADGYKKNMSVLLQILGPENQEETGMFTNFYWIMPMANYVEKYGLEDFDLSMKAIKEITKRNTGEYTIRPFLQNMNKKL